MGFDTNVVVLVVVVVMMTVIMIIILWCFSAFFEIEIKYLKFSDLNQKWCKSTAIVTILIHDVAVYVCVWLYSSTRKSWYVL